MDEKRFKQQFEALAPADWQAAVDDLGPEM